MRTLSAALILSCAALTGCTHRQLTRSTVLTAGTVVDTQYHITLNNLARMSESPESLPSHIDLADGVVQISDHGSFGGSGGLTTFGGTLLGIDQFGPSGGREVSEQWGADATTDPQHLNQLQAIYRAALGFTPLPVPNSIAYLSRADERESSKGKKDGSSATKQDNSASEGGDKSGGGSAGAGDGHTVPTHILLSDVPPPGWYHFGCRRDVPKDACYVGHHGDRYVWVTADGVPQLARFTLCVLAVVKYEPGVAGGHGGKRGLAVTGHEHASAPVGHVSRGSQPRSLAVGRRS